MYWLEMAKKISILLLLQSYMHVKKNINNELLISGHQYFTRKCTKYEDLEYITRIY